MEFKYEIAFIFHIIKSFLKVLSDWNLNVSLGKIIVVKNNLKVLSDWNFNGGILQTEGVVDNLKYNHIGI